MSKLALYRHPCMQWARALTLACLLPAVSDIRAIEVPFGPPRTISSAADGVEAVHAADIDGDGDVDLLSASANDDEVTWYENDGASAPAWIARTISTAADGASAVFAADVDGDGDMDALSASASDDEVTWYENDGASAPAWIARTISTAADGASAVFAADVDGDGDTDVVSGSSADDRVAWYQNDGASPPVWTTRTISTTANGVQSVRAADVDGDGDTDVLSGSFEDDRIAWYESNGASPPAWTARTISATADGAESIFVADVDRDGDTDVLSASGNDDRIAWYENNGASPPAWTARTVSAADGAHAVFAADQDGDGDIDVLSASANDDQVAWYENDGASPPAWTARVVSTDGDGALAVAAADLDGDGDLDVLSASANDAEVAWHENRTIHRNAVLPYGPMFIETCCETLESIAAADIDDDGDLDLLSAASDFVDEIAWYENDGSRFGWPTHTISTSTAGAESACAADMDGDGDLDVLSASFNDDRIAFFVNMGGSPPAWAPRTISNTANGASAVVAADIDGDGDMDALSASALDDRIAWYENNGSAIPGFTTRTISSTANGAQAVVAADLDADGDLDVISAGSGIAWYENDGARPPAWTARTIAIPVISISIVTADVDGDGDLDVLSGPLSAGPLVWYENNGARPPSWTARIIATLTNSDSVAVGDLDADGDLDVIAARLISQHFHWFENDGAVPPGWAEWTISTNSPNIAARMVAVADLDGDGDPDVVSVSGSEINWHYNLGGQFGLATADRAPASVADGQTAAVLAVTLTHLGRTGDTDAEAATLDLRFEESSGDPLTSAEANALFDVVAIHRDDGSGVFELGVDELAGSVGTLVLAEGRTQLALTDGDPDAAVAQGAAGTFFVVVTMANGAAAQPTHTFLVEHTPEGSTAEDRDRDIVLRENPVGHYGSSSLVLVGFPAGEPAAPLRVDRSTTPGALDLSWGGSCRGTDTGYAIYEGALGNYTSHTLKLCGVTGTTATINPAAGSRYYLVVALGQDGDVEGSYGTASSGAPRLPGQSVCRPLSIGSCP